MHLPPPGHLMPVATHLETFNQDQLAPSFCAIPNKHMEVLVVVGDVALPEHAQPT